MDLITLLATGFPGPTLWVSWTHLDSSLEDHPSGCKRLGSPPFISHGVRPFGTGPTTRYLGDLRSPWSLIIVRPGVILQVGDSFQIILTQDITDFFTGSNPKGMLEQSIEATWTPRWTCGHHVNPAFCAEILEFWTASWYKICTILQRFLHFYRCLVTSNYPYCWWKKSCTSWAVMYTTL